MTAPREWAVEMRRTLLVIGAGLLVGLPIGEPVTCVAIALAGIAAWHMYHVYLLYRWLGGGRRASLPRVRGLWGAVFEGLQRLERQNRKRKKRLRKVVARFEQAARAAPDAAVILRASGEILWLNPAAVSLLGLRYPQDVHQQITHLVRAPAFAEYFEGGRFDEPLPLVSPVDEEIRLLVRLVPYGANRRLLLARDVTRLHRLEQVRRDFVANVSHELRSPLTVIVGYLETIGMDENAPERWRRPLDQMSQQAARMMRIIEDLLRLSRIEGEAGAAVRHPVPVADVLQAIVDDARRLGGAGRRIEIELDPEQRLLGDHNELFSAFSNLVFNAVQYTPEDGRIAVRWRVDGEAAWVEVEDEGIGIEPHHIPRLTERFYRVDKARSRDVGGTGLGLAIVKHVLLRHDATLEIESEVGEGSRFLCRFPLSRVATPVAEAAAVTGR